MRFFSKTSRPPLRPIQPPTQWIPGFFPGGTAYGEWRWPFNLQLVPRLRMSGAVHLHSLYPFMVRTKQLYSLRAGRLRNCDSIPGSSKPFLNGYWGSIPEGKVAEACRWPYASIYCQGYEWVGAAIPPLPYMSSLRPQTSPLLLNCKTLKIEVLRSSETSVTSRHGVTAQNTWIYNLIYIFKSIYT
jgi:hypothetical protein